MKKLDFQPRLWFGAAATSSFLLISGCNSGDSGSNPDVEQAALLTASANVTGTGSCSGGGTEYLAGLDTDGNGTLDTGEVADSVQICSGAVTDLGDGSIFNVRELGFGDNRCSLGGFLVEASRDQEVVRTFTACNTDQAQGGADDLIGSLSANPTSLEVNDPFTLTAALARPPAENESFTIRWENLTSGEVLAETSESVALTAPASPADITFSVRVQSDAGIEEENLITVTVQPEGASNTTSFDAISTRTRQISVPAEFEQPEEQPQGDFDGAILFGGSSEASVELLSSNSGQGYARLRSSQVAINTVRAAALSDRQVAAFVAERPTLGAGGNAREVLENFANQVSASPELSLSNISTGQIKNGQTFLGVYRLGTDVLRTPTDVNNRLVQILGIDRSGGTITGLPTPLGAETPDQNYRLYMTVSYQDQGTDTLDDDGVVLLSSLVRESDLSFWENPISRFSSGRNIASRQAVRTAEEDSFGVSAGSQLADFLFVIDNSASMSDNQQALADAADAFIQVLQSSGLDSHIGTINTGSEIELADSNGDGFFTTDFTEFRDDVVNQGTGGSFRETGIYNAEQALQSVAAGDSSDGIVTAAGYPRAGAKMSVIILSDEPSQYSSRAGFGVEFDPQNNLFIERGFTVFSLVESGDSADSQYDDLAASTGGNFADIANVSDFSLLMEEISKNAGGASSSFELADDADPVSIEVKKNGAVIPIASEATDGWIYRPLSNTVLLRGNAQPAEGDDIEIRYTTLQ